VTTARQLFFYKIMSFLYIFYLSIPLSYILNKGNVRVSRGAHIDSLCGIVTFPDMITIHPDMITIRPDMITIRPDIKNIRPQ
jgi:hypothetical protein